MTQTDKLGGDESQFDIPILFIIFNRPNLASSFLGQIKRIRPRRLYVAADGPRKDHPEDIELCGKTRQILESIDWPCEVDTLFRNNNLGRTEAVSSAISWFFDKEEMGIILEDDCYPDISFFDFCRELLIKYKDDERVMMVSGSNYLFGEKLEYDYFFSYYYSVWGWASWRRAWELFDITMNEWPTKKNIIDDKFKDKKASKFVKTNLEKVYVKDTKTWDGQWTFSCMLHDGLSATSSKNLVSNIGSIGTHKLNKRKAMIMNMQIEPIHLPLDHPPLVTADNDVDERMLHTLIRCYRPTMNDRFYRVYRRVVNK